MSQYQPGETIRATVNAQIISVLDEGPRGRALLVQLTMKDGSTKQGRIHLDAPGVTIEQLVPADGAPRPGQMWATTDGTEWYASHRKGCGPDIYLQAPDGRAWHWLDVHTGEHGPITLVRPVPAKPDPAESPLTAADLIGKTDVRVIAEQWNGGQPVRIISAHAGEHFDEVSIRWQDARSLYPATSDTVPRTMPFRLVGGA